MIRVRVKASSPRAQASLEGLLRSHPGFDSDLSDPDADVWLVEVESLADTSAREALDWANAGGPVVLLIRNPAAGQLAEALRAGVKAVLPSTMGASEIVAAIEAAAAGLVVLEGGDVETLLRAPSPVSGDADGTLVESLTPREIEVLRLVAAGLGNKEIAARLEISDHTVKFHVASIMGKLGATSRTEAVTLGIRRGSIMV